MSSRTPIYSDFVMLQAGVSYDFVYYRMVHAVFTCFVLTHFFFTFVTEKKPVGRRRRVSELSDFMTVGNQSLLQLLEVK